MDAAGTEWAGWLAAHRVAIDRALGARLGVARPAPAAPESEALRRFRSYATAALRAGRAAEPSLDGVRVDAERATAVLDAWCKAAADVAGSRRGEVEAMLEPLASRFGLALRGVHVAARARRSPRKGPRAVAAAIDRIADAFLAVDLDSGRVVDANPAACALLGLERASLLDSRAISHVHPDTRARWRDHLEALVESPDPRRFRVIWSDSLSRPIAVEAHATCHATRARTLALVTARPISP